MSMLQTPPEWMDDALCTQSDPEEWFPLVGKSGRFARSLCAQCPVREMCLQYAIEHHEIGIWGGTSEMERRELRKDTAA